MQVLVVLLILVLCVLHHDVWWWDTPGPVAEGVDPASPERFRGLVFGFMPISLAWHTALSLAAAGVWGLAVKFCWPALLDSPTEPTTEPQESQQK